MIKNCRLVSLIVGILALWSFVDTGALAIPEKTVVATGEAAVRGTGPEALQLAKDEAINRAQRRAIEQGIGTIVDSETMVENFQLLEDKVLSQVKGYITGFKVVKDNNGEGGVYSVTIEATVALAQIEKDVRALNIIKEKKNNPRMMVVIREYFEDPVYGADFAKGGAVAQTAMEKELLRLDFPLVDRGQMGAINERDTQTAYNDPAKAAALGKRFGAEVVIVGEATSAQMDQSAPHGVAVYHCDAQISAKAIKTDNAQIIASESVTSGRVVKGGRATAAKEALRLAGEKLASAMRSQILEKWRSEAFNTVSIQIIASNASNDRRRAFQKDLAAIRGVRNVSERSWTNEVLELDAEVDGALWNDFDKRIENLPSVGIELTGKTGNRIDLKLKDKPAPAAQEPKTE
ncbi:MAG: hypothetical protein NTX71_01315 [Candidatus Aureabacteria bacterium]|nr:hypothetical protein [Candidatus Auribacterota bacterium]